MKNEDKESTDRFRAKCDEIINAIDDKLGGLSGAMACAAQWLAWQWCFNGGPNALQKRLKERGEDDRAIQVSRAWPTSRPIFWRDASVELPDDDLAVLIALDDGEVWTGFYDASRWRYVSADLVEPNVTHWANFPEPPQAQSKR